MPFARAGDLTVAYEVTGRGDAPVLVLANALGTNFHVWDEVVDQLGREHRVIRYDMRGHGLSGDTRLDREDALTMLADDLVMLLDVLHVRRAAVAGLSLGGMVTQRAAARYPERFAAAALLATGNRIGTRTVWDERIAAVELGGVDAVADAVVHRWFTAATHAERPELIAGFKTMLRRTPPAGYRFGCRAVRDADLRAEDAALRCPVLVIAGAHDPVTPPSSGAEMSAAILGARMTVIDGAAHMLTAERPVETAAAILGFLRDVSAHR